VDEPVDVEEECNDHDSPLVVVLVNGADNVGKRLVDDEL
jgi:hypothetical protein